MEAAEANDCDVIIANDPDADRLAVAEKINFNIIIYIYIINTGWLWLKKWRTEAGRFSPAMNWVNY